MAPLYWLGIAFLVLAGQEANAQDIPSLIESYLRLILVDGSNNIEREPKDRQVIEKEYDFIIVGAGSAGCVVANRLTEVPHWKVLLIEAGDHENFLMDVPIMANFMQFTQANWGYTTEPSKASCLGMDKGRCHWPRGKVMGGSSVLNYMVYTRGNRRDYDHWEEMGNTGWNYRDVLYYYKKLEDLQIPGLDQDKDYHNTGGYMTISHPPYHTPIADAFLKAGQQAGFRINDYNGATQTGFSYVQASMRNGTRWSSSRAYLHPINKRPNLHVKKSSLVTKILIDPNTKTAVGVEFVRGKRRYHVRARKEVVLSAGTINSAQLLMLSGIGPRDHLEDKGIPVVQDLKVGYHLQDHTIAGGLTYIIDKPYSIITERIMSNATQIAEYFSYHQGPMSVPGGAEAIAFMDLNNPLDPDGYPDLEIMLISGSLSSEPTLRKNFNLKPSLYKEMYHPLRNNDTFMAFPVVLRPKSSGRILLKDNNPFHKPLIYTNWYTDPENYDVKVAIAGVRKMNDLVRSRAFKPLGTRIYTKPLPPCKKHPYDSDAYWECFVRHMSFTNYHHSGTCKMGPAWDPDAVVDPRLRVRGIKNLRVIDASIIPEIPVAHTNAPALMIGEKGSDLIKEDYGNIIR